VVLVDPSSTGEEDWWSNGKKVNASKASDLDSELRDLSATGFADSGFSHPTTELTATQDLRPGLLMFRPCGAGCCS